MNNTEDNSVVEEHFDIILSQVAYFYNETSSYEIEDLIQTGCLGAIKASMNYDKTRGTMRAYVFSCVSNHLLRFLSKEKFWTNQVTLGFSDFEDRAPSDGSDMIDRLMEAITRRLEPIEKTIILMRREGNTRKEICDLLSLTRTEYYSLFFSAVGKIRKNEN